MKIVYKTTSTFLRILVFCLLFLVFSSIVSSNNRVLVLQVYPRVFKFSNGEAALYYKQIGKEIVHAYLNGSEVSSNCYNIRYIYTGSNKINGYWIKCNLPSQSGTFIVKTDHGVHRYRNYDTFNL